MSKAKVDKNKQQKEEVQEYESTGTFELPNNTYYIGTYKKLINGNTIRTGYGKLVHRGINNSQIGEEYYEGNWENDKFNGFGKYQYSNGDVYTGEFKDNLHHGNGILKCIDGTSYEGQFENHKFHGRGTFYDIDGIAWRGEFREGFFSSKDQPRLKEERRIRNKVEEMQRLPYDKFFKQWEEVYSKLDKKTAKEQLSQFFASQETMGSYIKDPFPKLDEKNNDKWNEAFKFVFNQGNTIKINICRDDSINLFFDINRVLSEQFTEELSNGQVIEIASCLNERTIYLAIAYSFNLNRWLVIHFKDETVKLKK